MTTLTIEDIPKRSRRHTPPGTLPVRENDRDYALPLTWVVMGVVSLGAFRSYNDALVAIAQTILEAPLGGCQWDSVRIEGHQPSWTVGKPEIVRAFKRDGTAYIPTQKSKEIDQYRRSDRLMKK